jgi:hypothetical protein
VAFDVFINYRAADLRYGAHHELLANRFGRDRILLDNQAISRRLAVNPKTLPTAAR